MTAADVLQTLISGVLVGATYALMCVGLGLIFGVMRVVNFAQGEFVMLGMYVALYLATGVGLQAGLGQEFGAVAAAALTAPVVFAAAWLLHRGLLGRITAQATHAIGQDKHNAQVIMTLGLSLVLQNGAMILFGSAPRSVETPLATDSFEFGEILVNKGQVVTFAVAVLIALALGLQHHAELLRVDAAMHAHDGAGDFDLDLDLDRRHRLL